MPTKPTDLPVDWATDVNYTNGPFPGLFTKIAPPAAAAAEGHLPGQPNPTPAEWQNWQQYANTQFTNQWVALGTFNPDADAHIVETDANGVISAQRAIVESTADPLQDGVRVTASGANTAAVRTITNDVASIGYVHDSLVDGSVGLGFFMRGNNAAAVGGVINNGVGPALTVAAAGPGAGITGSANATTPCVDVTGFLGIPAVRGTSAANAAGIGVEGLTDDPEADGVKGTTQAAATAGGNAVFGEAFGDATGLRGDAEDGYGAVLNTGGALSCLRIVGHVGDVAGALDGDIDYNQTRDQFRVERGSERHGLWASPGGLAYGHSYANTVAAFTGFPAVLATVTTSGLNAPQQAGETIFLDLVFGVESTGGAPPVDVPLQLNDLTAAVQVWPPPGVGLAGFLPLQFGAGIAVNGGRVYHVRVPYVIPVAGNRTFDAIINQGGTAQAVGVAYTILGQFT